MEKYKVSIFTCVYNRTHTIERVFNSIKNQTYKNIEHIIVDDGSTDAIDQMVYKYIEDVNYPVIYIKKENGGKHTATNIAWDNSTGDFIIQLDSDDELFPHAIEFLVQTYENIPNDIKDDYWCVHGRCIDQINRLMVGNPYPKNINELPIDEAKKIASTTTGEKIGLMRRDKLVGYRYPIADHVTFVSESYIWKELNKKWRTWYTNEVVRVYYINEGESLSKPNKTPQVFSNNHFYSHFILENRKKYKLGFKALTKEVIHYSLFYELATKEYRKKYKYLLNKDLTVNVLLIMLKVPSILIGFYLKKKWKI